QAVSCLMRKRRRNPARRRRRDLLRKRLRNYDRLDALGAEFAIAQDAVRKLVVDRTDSEPLLDEALDPNRTRLRRQQAHRLQLIGADPFDIVELEIWAFLEGTAFLFECLHCFFLRRSGCFSRNFTRSSELRSLSAILSTIL